MSDSSQLLTLHPDRLFPADPGVRTLARDLYSAVEDLPIISPHGHIDAQTLVDNEPFTNPAELFITPDHYVTRMLHAAGHSLESLGIGREPLGDQQARAVWRTFCENWTLFAGTPVRYWFESELADIFHIQHTPSAATADAIYDEISDHLAEPGYRPLALLEQFNIDVLATTDDPAADLRPHDVLAASSDVHTRVLPTFRPDRYLDVTGPDWAEAVAELGAAADTEIGSYVGFITALERRRQHFVEHGAVSADHAAIDPTCSPLPDGEADRIYRAALAGDVSEQDAIGFRRHMLLEMARMSCDDGLVMTIHPGALRGYDTVLTEQFGPNQGHDIPVRTEYTRALRPMLERYGRHPNFQLVIFTLDETVWSRELAPLAGFFPSVYVGVPWWFLDAPDAIGRFRAAVTETAGFFRTSGFIDDTRAFCSIPARHDMARRLDCRYLATLVAEHRLGMTEAQQIATDLVATIPKQVFKL